MSQEQLNSFLDAIQSNAALQAKLEAADHLETVIALAKESGFNTDNTDWLRHQAQRILQLSDEELETIAGGEPHIADKALKASGCFNCRWSVNGAL